MTTATRADIRAQRRFAAMIDAGDFHGRPATLYTEAERLLDAMQPQRCPCGEFLDDHPAVACAIRDEVDGPRGEPDSGYGHGSGGNL